MKTPTKIREQLEQVLSHNSVEDVLDMLALVIDSETWVDKTHQTLAVSLITEASQTLKDRDWNLEIEGDNGKYEPT